MIFCAHRFKTKNVISPALFYALKYNFKQENQVGSFIILTNSNQNQTFQNRCKVVAYSLKQQ